MNRAGNGIWVLMTLKINKDWWSVQGYSVRIPAPYAAVRDWCLKQWGADPDVWSAYAAGESCEIWLANQTYLNELVLAWS
jgi:hypothetical protein